MTNHTETEIVDTLDGDQMTTNVIRHQGQIWTYAASSAADDHLVTPDGTIIDVILAAESGNWPSDAAREVCEFLTASYA